MREHLQAHHGGRPAKVDQIDVPLELGGQRLSDVENRDGILRSSRQERQVDVAVAAHTVRSSGAKEVDRFRTFDAGGRNSLNYGIDEIRIGGKRERGHDERIVVEERRERNPTGTSSESENVAAPATCVARYVFTCSAAQGRVEGGLE